MSCMLGKMSFGSTHCRACDMITRHSLPWCLMKYTSVCIHIHECICTFACVRDRVSCLHLVSLYCYTPDILRQGHLLILLRSAGQKTQGIPLFLTPQSWDCKCTLSQVLFCGFWELNSRPHACVLHALWEPSPWPCGLLECNDTPMPWLLCLSSHSASIPTHSGCLGNRD